MIINHKTSASNSPNLPKIVFAKPFMIMYHKLIITFNVHNTSNTYHYTLFCAFMWNTPAVCKQYNKMAVLHFFSSKFHSNIYSILFGFKCVAKNI